MKFKNFFPQKDNNYVVSKNLKLGLDIVLEVFELLSLPEELPADSDKDE